MTSPKILWIRERFSHMGSHSGYDQICEAIARVQADNCVSVWRDTSKPLFKGSRRILSRLSRNAKLSPYYDLTSTFSEVTAIWKCFRHKPKLLHITYIENNLGILPNYSPYLSLKLISTVHQPTSWWRLRHPHPQSIASLDFLIVLASREVSYFEQFLPGRVHFIPHGVDTEFFRPRIDSPIHNPTYEYPRCVFAGSWLRDIPTLIQVVDKVLARNPSIHFDIILPRNKRNDASLYRIARYNQVFWHANISDEQLRDIYQRASLLFLPLLDCTANNALLEAMACGLPIVSNNVGGLPDYTMPTFANLVPVGDVDGFTNTILKLVDDPQERQSRGSAARLFAEQNFSWNQIAIQTLEIYQRVSDENCLY